MKSVWKSYCIFAPSAYRLVCVILIPLILIGIEVLSVLGLGVPMGQIEVIIFVTAEAFADNWVLNGICDKKSISLDYLKSSSRGMPVMKSVILADMLQRFIKLFVVFGLCAVIGVVGKLDGFLPDNPEFVMYYVANAAISFGFSTIAIWICRHLDSTQIMIAVNSGAVVGASSVSLAALFSPVLVALITIVVSLAAAVGIYFYTVKRVEGTYYDERH